MKQQWRPNILTTRAPACKHEHQTFSTSWVDGKWQQRGECVLCGATMWVLPIITPTERVDAYKTLRTAYHARRWR